MDSLKVWLTVAVAVYVSLKELVCVTDNEKVMDGVPLVGESVRDVLRDRVSLVNDGDTVGDFVTG